MSENLIGATTAVFPIRLSVAVASPVDVEWATRDGSAVAGSDYKATAGTVTFLPGETEKQIEVQVYGQAITPSDDKVFFIRLNPPSNAVLVDAVLTCTINIIDDQGIPSVAVVVAEGRRGPKGDPGLSAYEQAVLMGYTGTLTEWMDQIADASKAADRAGDHAVSASEDALKAQEDALKAQNAAKNAVFAGVVFPTAAEGVDPVLGVQNGAYFNVRSPLSEHYIDEYQNVNGVAVATGKSYPTSDYVQDISEYIALPFVLETVYKLNQRVVLTNGYIVKSTVDGNTNNPNVDMTGWVYSSLTPSNNLSDVEDKAEARTNLEVYSKSEVTTAIANATPTIPNATETTAGKAKIATTTIAKGATNHTDIITAKGLAATRSSKWENKTGMLFDTTYLNNSTYEKSVSIISEQMTNVLVTLKVTFKDLSTSVETIVYFNSVSNWTGGIHASGTFTVPANTSFKVEVVNTGTLAIRPTTVKFWSEKSYV